jgi:SAM-dependent methyltransferase
MSQRTPGFSRDDLRARYDVPALDEDEWHTFGDAQRRLIVQGALGQIGYGESWFLNAGAGVHSLGWEAGNEVLVDLFSAPIAGRRLAVCADIGSLPFQKAKFGAVVCTGEVLGYCDPARAFSEFSRVASSGGILILDFASTRSARYWWTKTYARTADLVTVQYNGRPERIWIYDPKYIYSLLVDFGFQVDRLSYIYTWSVLLNRFGVGDRNALKLERCLRMFPLPISAADIIVIVARRVEVAT